MSSATSTPGKAVDAVTLDEFLRLDDAIGGAGPEWLRAVRGSALERARELGLPARTDEAWRYTNPKPIVEGSYAPPEPGVFEGEAEIDPLKIEHTARLVFVDGRFAPGLSDLAQVPPGVAVTPLDQAGGDAPDELLQPIVADAIERSRDGFEALGAGLLTGGVLVHVSAGVELAHPIVVVFRSTGGKDGLLTAPQVVVAVDEGARARLVEDHQGAEGATGLTLGRTNLRVGRAASLEHTTLQRESSSRHWVSTLQLVQEADSFARSSRIMLGGAIARNNILATLGGERCETAFNGLFLPEHAQHHDNDIRVEHMAPHCHSRQFYRGMLADKARGVFTGRIYVQDVAQKTDAIQSNSNLLLSRDAQVTTKPQLEIYADDVRCTHGATTGEFNEDALFYLRARGVSEKDARLLLLHAFAGENIDRIDNESLREVVRGMIHDRLDAALERNA